MSNFPGTLPNTDQSYRGYEAESLHRTQPAPAPVDWRAVAEKQFAALQVIGLSVTIRDFLIANDPMALKQIGNAVSAYRAALEAEAKATK